MRCTSGDSGSSYGAVDAREVLQLALARLRVQALGIALLALGDRRIHEYLEELARPNKLARHAAARRGTAR